MGVGGVTQWRVSTSGLPRVRVPVLSSTMQSTLPMFSRAKASLMRMWFWAPFPMPTIRAVGVARPMAHGQAITRTETAVSRAMGKWEAPPTSIQMPNVTRAIIRTAGTNTALTLSAIFCTGALLPWASRTMRTIWARTVPLPTWVARIVNEPSWLMVPARTLSPGCFSVGRGSPLIILSSTYESPSSTMPSTGIRSPGRTTTRSPTCSIEIGISFSVRGIALVGVDIMDAPEIVPAGVGIPEVVPAGVGIMFGPAAVGQASLLPSTSTRAVLGWRPMRPLMAEPVLFFALSSRNLPSSTNDRIMPAAS